MVFSSKVVGGHELRAHGLGPLSEVAQHPLAVTLLKVILPPVGVFLPLGEHGLDQSGQLVGSSRHRARVKSMQHTGAGNTLPAPTGSTARPQQPFAVLGPRGWHSVWSCHASPCHMPRAHATCFFGTICDGRPMTSVAIHPPGSSGGMPPFVVPFQSAPNAVMPRCCGYLAR